MAFIRIKAWENHACLSYCDSSKSAERWCTLIITVARTSNLLIHKKPPYPAPHVEFFLKHFLFNVDLTKYSDSLGIMKSVHPYFVVCDAYNLKRSCMLLKMPERFLPRMMLIYVIHKSLRIDIQINGGGKQKKNSHNKAQCGNSAAVSLCDPWYTHLLLS